MLQSYEDANISLPNANSVILRYLQIKSMHAIDHSKKSWYRMGEVVRLAQDMRMYDERSYAGMDRSEASLRRNIFWQVCIEDKSAAMFTGRPIILHSYSLGTTVPSKYPSPDDPELLERSPEQGGDRALEQCLRVGFTLSI